MLMAINSIMELLRISEEGSLFETAIKTPPSLDQRSLRYIGYPEGIISLLYSNRCRELSFGDFNNIRQLRD